MSEQLELGFPIPSPAPDRDTAPKSRQPHRPRTPQPDRAGAQANLDGLEMAHLLYAPPDKFQYESPT